jgi:hypothetical protein
VTSMFSRSDALMHGPLFRVSQQVAGAEERREQQMRIPSGLTQGSPARVDAEHVLSEIERTIVLSRIHQELIENLFGDQHEAYVDWTVPTTSGSFMSVPS